MARKETNGVAIGALIAPVLPVAAVYLYQTLQGAPVYQPLGVTREKLAAFDPDLARATVQVRVEWGTGVPDEVDRDAYLARVTRTLSARTEDFTFDIEEVDGNGIALTFAVAGQVLGPYPPAGVVGGLQDAIGLQKMLKFSSGQ